jgi:hypothetical protein
LQAGPRHAPLRCAYPSRATARHKAGDNEIVAGNRKFESISLQRRVLANLTAWSSPRRQWASGSRMIAPGDKAEPVVDVIDDDPDIRDALRGLLRAVGLRVESFASVEEFLDSAPGCAKLGSRAARSPEKACDVPDAAEADLYKRRRIPSGRPEPREAVSCCASLL